MNKPEVKPKTIAVHVRLSEASLAKLRLEAARCRRAVAWLAARYIEDGLAAHSLPRGKGFGNER